MTIAQSNLMHKNGNAWKMNAYATVIKPSRTHFFKKTEVFFFCDVPILQFNLEKVLHISIVIIIILDESGV